MRLAPAARWLGGWLGLLALLAWVYQPALRGALLWNDADYVTKPALQPIAGLRRIWFEPGATEQYYPVLHSFFWFEHRLWGDAALGYHWANLLLHALGAGLFALVLRRWSVGATPAAAGAAALLFAVHLVAVESVAWISEEKNTLSLVFLLGAALVWCDWEQRRTPGRYSLALALFAAAVLSKSVTATLPALLVVRGWWREGRVDRGRTLAPLLPFFALGAAGGLFTGWVEKTLVGASGPSFGLSGAARLLLAARSAWFYAGKLLWPSPLMFIYPRWDAAHPGVAGWAAGGAVLLVTAGLWSGRGRSRAPLACWLLFLGLLFPVLGFFNIYAFVFSYVADHWAYLACLVPAAIAGAAGEAWFRRVPRWWVRGVLGALVGVLAVMAHTRAAAYRDVRTLYEDTLRQNETAWLAQTNLGALDLQSGDARSAIGHYRAALRIVPGYPEIHSNLADALLAAGRPSEAIVEYRRATAVEPRYLPAHVNLARTLLATGDPAAAVAEYRQAERLRPDDPEREHELGVALARAGAPAEAELHDRKALALRPDFPEAENSLAFLLAPAGKLEEARALLRAALRQRPGYSEARRNLSAIAYRLGNDEANAGHLPAAIRCYREALAARPDFVEAHAFLGAALILAGASAEGRAEWSEAIRLQPQAAGPIGAMARSLSVAPPSTR